MKTKKNLNCSALWYYNLSNEKALTVRYIVELKDAVDGELLRKAMEMTVVRYPYLLDKVVASGEAYHLEPCTELPIVVKRTHHAITLCGEEANYHQFALSYADHTIFFNNTHSIFDGRGRGPLLHTLLYCYFKLRYPEDDVQMPGVWTPDSPINPAEYYDPFTQTLPEPRIPMPEIQLPSNVMDLSGMGLVHPSHIHLHHISIDEKQLMQCCKSSDATPNTAISLLMSRAIASLHPDSEKSISAGVYCDLRSVLKADLTHEPLVTTLELEYSKDMWQMDFSEQNTIFRGKMLLQSEETNLLNVSHKLKECNDAINSQPTLEAKKSLAEAMMLQIVKSHTFSVSYSGKSSYGNCSKYIAALFPEVQAKGIGILIEIASADGKFLITFIQEWREEVYFNAFLKELTKQGLDYDLLYSTQNEPATVNIG